MFLLFTIQSQGSDEGGNSRDSLNSSIFQSDQKNSIQSVVACPIRLGFAMPSAQPHDGRMQCLNKWKVRANLDDALLDWFKPWVNELVGQRVTPEEFEAKIIKMWNAGLNERYRNHVDVEGKQKRYSREQIDPDFFEAFVDLDRESTVFLAKIASYKPENIQELSEKQQARDCELAMFRK